MPKNLAVRTSCYERSNDTSGTANIKFVSTQNYMCVVYNALRYLKRWRLVERFRSSVHENKVPSVSVLLISILFWNRFRQCTCSEDAVAHFSLGELCLSGPVLHNVVCTVCFMKPVLFGSVYATAIVSSVSMMLDLHVLVVYTTHEGRRVPSKRVPADESFVRSRLICLRDV